MSTWRDLVDETNAMEILELQDRIGDLEANVQIYQELVCAAFDALHDLTVSRDREREEHWRVRDAYRALREQLLLQAGADDEETAA